MAIDIENPGASEAALIAALVALLDTSFLTPAEGNAAYQPLFGTSKAKADKNNVNQTGIADGVSTAVTFGTERYDVGDDFASDAWTPPAGYVHITTRVVAFPAVGWAAAGQTCSLKKNGTTIAEHVIETTASATNFAYFNLDVDDQANGTDVYTVEVTLDVASSTGSIRGATRETFFCGHMI